MLRALLFSSCLAFACSNAQPLPEPEPGATASPIINGSRTTAFPEVVAVVQVSGGDFIAGLCTGTVIGGTHVLTAKHCIFNGTTRVSTSNLRIFIGNSVPSRVSQSPSSFRTVTAIATTPGPYTDDDLTNGTDIAVLTTGSALGTPVREVARSTARRGAPITIVGFGRNAVGSGASGTKFQGTTNVGDTYVQVFQTMGTSRTCQGDSGGPAFDAAGRVIGVTSFGVDERCAVDMSFYTETAPHLALIAGALGREAPCTPAAETCNGADDSCDGMVDPGCGNLGADCVDDEECETGDCRILGERRVCTSSCNPFDADGTAGCDAGAICDVVTCGAGACVPGAAGGAPDGAACTRDGDCVSAHCQRLASGRSVCGRPCTAAGVACPDGFSCETGGTPCGACVATESPMLPFGTACSTDFECASGDCDDSFCTQPCTSNAQCPGFRCGASGVCEIGRPASHGEMCADPSECAAGLACVAVDGDMVCTSGCEAGCPDGTVCDRGACLPPGSVLGTACTTAEECRSGICAGTCTRLCTDASECPDTFECRPAGELSGCFPPVEEPPPPMEGGGGKCSASAGAGGSTVFGLAMLGVAVVLVGRRRR